MEKAERIQTEDKAEDGKVALYLFEVIIDGERYGGDIPAKSWKEAQKQVHSFGGIVLGLGIESILDKQCAICRGDIKEDLENPKGKPVFDEFPELIDD